MQNMSYMYVIHVYVMQHDTLTEYNFYFIVRHAERENKADL